MEEVKEEEKKGIKFGKYILKHRKEKNVEGERWRV